MSNVKCWKHNYSFEFDGFKYQFKVGLSCNDCCFCQEDADGDFLCEVPFGVPYCQNGGFVAYRPDKSFSHVELADDQVLIVIDALEAYRQSVTDADLYERLTSCLVVFENI